MTRSETGELRRDIGFTGSRDFGEVCPEELAEKVFNICNFGVSNLEVTFVGFDPPCRPCPRRHCRRYLPDHSDDESEAS